VLGARPVGVPIDAAGMRTALLEPLLQQHRVRLIYTVPNFANPSGACLSGPRRRQLLALADRYNVPVLEDDFAGDLRYEGRAQPAVKALDSTGQVIYTGTFSKMMMPGLRVGYLLADGPVLGELARRKRVQDLTTSPLLQRVLDRHVTVGRYQAHLRRTGRLYRERRDVLLAALRASLPEVVVADPPKGGLFAWATTPVPARTLLPVARAEGVDFAPGHLFFPRPRDGDGYLRLNFATVEPDRIAVGVERLARAVHALR
jgi:GntR family transcriptional regulator/MocR family aminotransferase